MVIRPLDDPIRYAQSVVADLAAMSKGDCWTPGLRGYGGMGCRGWAHSIARAWVYISFPLIWSIYYRFRVIWLALKAFPLSRPSARRTRIR